MKTMVEWAEEYVRRGWLVLPLVPNGKTPLLANGVNGASKDLATVRKWFTENPTANVGIATGRGDCGPYVVDIDAPHGGHKHDGAASLSAAGITLPDTLTAPFLSTVSDRYPVRNLSLASLTE